MDIIIKDTILSIVTCDLNIVQGGGCPVFLAQNEEQQQKMSLLLARVLGGNAHALENGVNIIVKH